MEDMLGRCLQLSVTYNLLQQKIKNFQYKNFLNLKKKIYTYYNLHLLYYQKNNKIFLFKLQNDKIENLSFYESNSSLFLTSL